MMGKKKGQKPFGAKRNRTESSKSTNADSSRNSQTNTLSDYHTDKKYTSINDDDDDDLMCLNDIPGYDVNSNNHLPKDVSNRKLKSKARLNECTISVNTETNAGSSSGRYKTISIERPSKRSNTCTDNKVDQFEVKPSGSGILKPAMNLDYAETENNDLKVGKTARMSISRKRKVSSQIEGPCEQNSAPLSEFINNSANRSNENKKKFSGNPIVADFSNWDGIESAIDAMGQEEKLISKTTVKSSGSSSNSILRSRNITWLKSRNELDENLGTIEHEPLEKKIKLEPEVEFPVKSKSNNEMVAQLKPVDIVIKSEPVEEIVVKSEPLSYDNISYSQFDKIAAHITKEELKAALANVARCSNKLERDSVNTDVEVKSEPMDFGYLDKSSESTEVVDDDIFIVYDSTCEERTSSISINMDERPSCSKLTLKGKPPLTFTQEVNNGQDSVCSKPILKELLLNHKQQINNSEGSSHSKPILKETSLNLKESSNSSDDSQIRTKVVRCLLNNLTSHVGLILHETESLKSALKRQFDLGAITDENYAIGSTASKEIKLNDHNINELSTESIPSRPESASQLAKQSSLIQGRPLSQPDNLTNSWVVEDGTDKPQQDIANFKQCAKESSSLINSGNISKSMHQSATLQNALGSESVRNSVIERKHEAVKECDSVESDKNLEPVPHNAKIEDASSDFSASHAQVTLCDDQSSQRISANDIALPLNFRNMLHLIQQVEDDSTDSDKSSLKLEKSLKNIILRYSSSKMAANSIGNVELDGSGSAVENSKSVIVNEVSQSGPRSACSPCPQNSSVISEDKNKQHCDASAGSLNENDLPIPSTSLSKPGASAKVLRDGGEDQLNTSVDAAKEVALIRLLSQGMLIDNMNRTVTLSINHFVKYFLKVYDEKTKAASELRACREEIKSHNQHIEETQKRIDQLRAAMRVHIMQQEAYYRNCGWHRQIDTRTVGVNVRILEESDKVPSNETAFLQNKKVSEEILAPLATDDTTLISVIGRGLKVVKNNDDEDAHNGKHRRANISNPPKKKFISKNSAVAPPPQDSVCNNTRQKKRMYSVSAQKVVGAVSQLHEATDNGGGSQVIDRSNSFQTGVDNSSKVVQKSKPPEICASPSKIVHVSDFGKKEFYAGGIWKKAVYPRNPEEKGSVNTVRKIGYNSPPPQVTIGIKSSSQAAICSSGPPQLAIRSISPRQVAVRSCGPSQVGIRSGGPQVGIRSGGPQVGIRSGGPQVAFRSAGPSPVTVHNYGSPQITVLSNGPPQVTTSNNFAPQLAIPSNDPPQNTFIGNDSPKIKCSGDPSRITESGDNPQNIISKIDPQDAINSSQTSGVVGNTDLQNTFSSGSGTRIAISSLSSHSPTTASTSYFHPLTVSGSNPPPVPTCNIGSQIAIDCNNSLQVAIDSSGTPQIKVDNSPLQIAASSRNPPQKIFLIHNSPRVPVYGSVIPQVAAYCKDSSVIVFDNHNPSRVNFGSNASSHIIQPGNHPQVSIGSSNPPQVSIGSSNPPQVSIGSSNSPQGVFSNSNPPQGVFSNSNPSQVAFSANDSFQAAFDGSKSVATGTVSLQGIINDNSLAQRFICSNSIGSPQVLMPVDSKLCRQNLRTLRPRAVTQNNDVEVVAISSDDEDAPPPVIKENKNLGKKTAVIPLGRTLFASNPRIPNGPIVPSLASMLHIIPSTSSIRSALPVGNMQIVQPSDPALTTQVAYLLPPFRSPTPGESANMVMFTTPIVTPSQPAEQTATTRPVLALRQIMMAQQAERPTIETFPQLIANLQSPNSQLTLIPRFTKHPAPLPQPPNYPLNPGLKLIPPKPSLKADRSSTDVILAWNMPIHNEHANIFSYQIYAYQEEDGNVDSSLWKKLNDIKAMPLPMACTLSRFPDGHKYHFTVRAVDIHKRVGPFSDSVSIQLNSNEVSNASQK